MSMIVEEEMLKTIGSNIQKYRKKSGLTQKDLAIKIGKTESSIRKYEKGLVQIPMNVINCIAEAINVKVIDIMDFQINIADIEKKQYISLKSHLFSKVIENLGYKQTVVTNLNSDNPQMNLLFMSKDGTSIVKLNEYNAIEEDAIEYFSFRLIQLINKNKIENDL